jgi:glutamate-1-semialdehyde 2,1-aminomutase
VLEAVRNELTKGVNFCRPSIIEGELAELLVDVIPSAEMVKFGKNGSDAVTAAVKLARAYTRREYVVRCESDPFNSIHDWFIGSTVVNRGVPESSKELTLKFRYNDIDHCKQLFDLYPGQIACFVFEPVSYIPPEQGFLQALKLLCETNGALLIFDEVISGFRFAMGGVQEMVGVTPHLSAFGKAMANGFSVSALVGQSEFMKLGGIDHNQERVFLLSTTHGGETHSIAAAIATINELKKHNVIEHFNWVGEYLKTGIDRLASETGLNDLISTFGYNVKPGLSLLDEKGNSCTKLRSLFLQETSARGLLVPYIVPSYAHNKEDLDFSLHCMHEAMLVIKDAIEGPGIEAVLRGSEITPVFRKYN